MGGLSRVLQNNLLIYLLDLSLFQLKRLIFSQIFKWKVLDVKWKWPNACGGEVSLYQYLTDRQSTNIGAWYYCKDQHWIFLKILKKVSFNLFKVLDGHSLPTTKHILNLIWCMWYKSKWTPTQCLLIQVEIISKLKIWDFSSWSDIVCAWRVE